MQQQSRSYWGLYSPSISHHYGCTQTLSSEQQKTRAWFTGSMANCLGMLFFSYMVHCRTWQNKPNNNLLREHPSSNTLWHIMITGKRKSCMAFAILQFISCLLKGDFGSSHCRVHCAVMRRLCSPCFDSHFACQSPITVYSYYYRTTFGLIQCETVVEIKYIHFSTNLRYLKL